MTYDEAIRISEELRGSLNGSFSTAERAEIERLYEAVLARPLKRTNCQRCYHDALIEVICFLKKEQRMAERSKYVMRAGFIIHSPNFAGGKIYTNDNLTDEIAERYMEEYPQRKNMFDLREKPVFAVNDTQPKRKRNTRKKNAK